MKLVFIYGPPASGKLTVARELSKLTGFKLFDNHVSIRFVESLFDFGTRPFLRLTGKYRMEMIEKRPRRKESIPYSRLSTARLSMTPLSGRSNER